MREEIIKMAIKAHLVMYDYEHPSLERFAALVAAAEREACAKLCETFYNHEAKDCAEAIRARGQA